MRSFAVIAAALMLGAPVTAANHHHHHPVKAPAAAISTAAQQALAPVIADARRDKDRDRDAHRHPVETLAFFRVEPGMTVVDYMPFGRLVDPHPCALSWAQAAATSRSTPMCRAAEGRMKTDVWQSCRHLPAKSHRLDRCGGRAHRRLQHQWAARELNGTVDRVLIFREMHNI